MIEVIQKFQNDYVQLEKIQKETLKPQGTKIQLPTQINAHKTTLVKENDMVKIPYQHPNHKNRNSTKWEMSKDNDTNMIKAPNERSVGNPNNQQKINLGWIDPSTCRKLCFILSSSYQHVSSATTSQRTTQQHYKALRTKPF